MAIDPNRLRTYVDVLTQRLDISPELAEQALLRKGRMPNPPEALFREASNFDAMGMSGMPAQADLKNFYLDELDIAGNGQPRSSLKPGNIKEIAPTVKPLDVQQSAATPAPKTTATPSPAATKVSTTPTAKVPVAKPRENKKIAGSNFCTDRQTMAIFH